MNTLQFLKELASTLRPCMREMVWTDLAYKLLAFWLLTPALGLLLQCSLWLSGQPVLSDLDIAAFLLGPVGWAVAILLGAVWLAIVALEQGSLLAILAARHQQQRLGVREALQWSLGHAVPVLRVAGRLVAWTLLLVAPFAVVAGLCYVWLLGEFDINYYLKERPREFQVAVGLGLVLACACVWLLLRFYANCFLALQLVVFDGIPAREALTRSRESVGKRRLSVLHWLALWLVTAVAVNTFVTASAGWIGQQLMPSADSRLAGLSTRVGLMVLVYVLSSLAVNILFSCSLAALLFNGYHRLHNSAESVLSSLEVRGTSHTGPGWITRFRATVAVILVLPMAALIGLWLMHAAQEERPTEIMAHRGASHVAPENTLAAIRQAIADQADWVEIDVQETADGKVVVVHDSDFMKLANNPLKIWNAPLAALEEIDIGTWFAPEFSEERVPTLKEVLELCRDQIGVIIELKYYGHDQRLEPRVIEVVESLEMSDQIMVMSLKPDRVAIVKELRPEWKCGVLMSVSLGDIKNFQADFLAVNAGFVGRQFINRAHRAGKEVFVWTVNDALSMSAMMNKGVDGILTDRPELALQVRRSRAEMNGVERLLLEFASLFGTEQRLTEQ